MSAERSKFPVPVAAPENSRGESLMPPDVSLSAEAVTIGDVKLRMFQRFARLLKLVYWYCKGSELELRFRLEPHQITVLRHNPETVCAVLQRIHSVFFGHFCGQFKPEHQCPIVVRKLTYAGLDDNELVLVLEVETWFGRKADDPPDAPARIVGYRQSAEEELLRPDDFVEAACWGNFSPGINDDAFECTFTFVAIDDFEKYCALLIRERRRVLLQQFRERCRALLQSRLSAFE